MLDGALGPRLAGLKVYAVSELARVYQLRVLNSSMAADSQVVSRDGASWVQRKQPCVALLDLAPEDQEQQQNQEQQEQEQGEVGADGSSRALAAEGEINGADGSSTQPGENATAAKPGGDLEAAAESLDAAAVSGSQQQQGPIELVAADGSSGGRADTLFVVCPEKLIECCHQVSAEVSAYIGLLAEEAGCGALDVGGLTALLEKLLMVQVSTAVDTAGAGHCKDTCMSRQPPHHDAFGSWL